MSAGFDPAILQDFLTEAGELLEGLDRDLVTLEESPSDPELLNQVFRALHTIKGSASFLALTNLVRIAHAAESALNAARNRVVIVDRATMDLLLAAVDVIKVQFDDLRAGQDLTEPDAGLVAALTEIGEGRKPSGSASAPVPTAPADAVVAPPPAAAPVAASPDAIPSRPIEVDESKADLVTFLATDLRNIADRIESETARLQDPAAAPEAATALAEVAIELTRAVEFFGFEPLLRLAAMVGNAAVAAARPAPLGELLPRTGVLVSLLRLQAEALDSGTILMPACEPLAASLGALSRGEAVPNGPAGQAPAPGEPVPLALPSNKLDLLEYFVDDLRGSAAALEAAVTKFATGETRAAGAGELAALGDPLGKAGEFFEIPAVERVARTLASAGPVWAELEPEALDQLLPRLRAVGALLTQTCDLLGRGMAPTWEVSGLCGSIEAIVEHGEAPEGRELPTGCDAQAVLAADGVINGGPCPADDEPGVVCAAVVSAHPAATEATAASGAPSPAATDDAGESGPASAAGSPTASQAAAGANAVAGASADHTIRVEVGRLEALLNLVGELVLQKNRLAAIARQAGADGLGTQDFRDGLTQAMSGLERTTSDIQVAVMRTRMQPLEKLFGRYPRLIRDLSRKTNKQIRLVIEGGDTEVDKSVIEELGDPLVHLLRNSADHGIEMPADRVAAGKPELGTIRIVASNEGGHVQVLIIDDGRGLSRERIGRKAVERGLVSEAQLATLSDREVYNYIFAAGFSTAEQVSDLSGRGVGMDVVRTNIEALKGTVELSSDPGKSTTITIKIPLTVAIMTAMMVGVGPETYAIPLTNIVEIVKPEPKELSTIRTKPVMRLRDGVLPLLDAGDVFSLGESKRERAPFAVVMGAGEKRVGLLVSRLIGQQEIVIKPLDEMIGKSGPVSGATVRDDGGVSLIVDVAQMVKMAEEQRGQAVA